MNVRQVLVFPAGTEIGLEIFHALQYCKEIQLHGAGQPISNPAQLVYPDYHPLPSIHEADWLPRLVTLCKQLKIDYIFPAYDDAIIALHEVAEQLPAVIVGASAEVCSLTRLKSSTYARLRDTVAVPRVFRHADEVTGFPVFVKPDRGQGSQGVARCDDAGALHRACAALPDPLICQYLPGEEFTVDCFSDRERGLLYASARRRLRIRNGIAVNSVTEELPQAQAMAARISDELNMRGAWFFQVKRAADGALTLLEVAPRIAGSMSTNRVRGVNFPLLSLYEQERAPLGILAYEGCVEVDRALGNRYRHDVQYATLYVDLDDTLIFRDQVNTQVVSLVYRALNLKRKVKLITRHRHDLDATLARHRLAGLFDEIIHITDGTPKSAFIRESDAILVDDSYAERLEVSRSRGIHTFDCSMIDMLLSSPDQ
ncbi:ATP-grasp domain-containing protein [Pseudomonas silvicola]|uniref:ATP-grasp domain-containing protein n=1 Tax=Pseudomonas sp. RIT-To-2 TaxID=3462541 RepID=UPI00227B8425|nr:ATP-grasp domain-containing protein [Pseudomonas silvicola]